MNGARNRRENFLLNDTLFDFKEVFRHYQSSHSMLKDDHI
jgi:hypothetical protein